MRELVPRGQLAAAVTLNAVANNSARAVGPALGGLVIALASVSAAFYLNAVATLVLVGALLWWRREIPIDYLPRERIGSAIVTGWRYVAETRVLRAVLARGMGFGFAASAVLALLPLIARDRLGGGALGSRREYSPSISRSSSAAWRPAVWPGATSQMLRAWRRRT